MLNLSKGIRRRFDARSVRSTIGRYFEERLGPGRVRLGAAIKVVESRQVFAARLDNLPVIVKRISNADPAARITAIRAELLVLARHMSDGPYRANGCLYSDAEAGIVVLSLAEGLPLRACLGAADPQARRQLIRRSGAWLGHYCQGREKVSQFAPLRVLDRCREEARDDLLPEDMERLGDLWWAMERFGRRVRGVQVRRGATHHDFVPRNLMVTDAVMTGVDIEAEIWMPLARNAARLLVWTAIKLPSDGPTRYGLPDEDVTAIWESGLLLEEERETSLPLFIAKKLQLMLQESQGNPRALARTRQAIEDWLSQVP